MGIFFGTDGLRGVVNKDLTFDIARRVGNSLTCVINNPSIIIGSDTRISNSYIMLGVAAGALAGGAKVIDIGVVPTAGIAFITKMYGADFGVVISASHNSAEYNGIKVFDKNGNKLNEKEEENLEKYFIHEKTNDYPQIGKFEQDLNLYKKYENHLVNSVDIDLSGLTVVLDGSNGASHKIAPSVFRQLGAKVYATNCKNDGMNINKNCGSLYPERLAKKVLKYKGDMGFAFDGDADRVIAVDENGKIFDGDMILYIMAKYLSSTGQLNNNEVVGTTHTNMGLQIALKKYGIDLIRVNIGDKFVIAKMLESNISIGGEQSGHIILKNHASTGDGILTAIQLAAISKKCGKRFSEMFDAMLYPQVNINIKVKDKLAILNSEDVFAAVNKATTELGNQGRVMLRASGTEPKIRIMVECLDENLANTLAKNIENEVMKANEAIIAGTI